MLNILAPNSPLSIQINNAFLCQIIYAIMAIYSRKSQYVSYFFCLWKKTVSDVGGDV